MTPREIQSEQALRRANETRLAHADIIRSISRTERPQALTLARGLLDHPDGPAATLRLDRLIKAVPGIGPERCRLILRHVGLVGGPRRVGDLTPRQRRLVAEALDAPTAKLRTERGLPEPVLDQHRVASAVNTLRKLRPDVPDPASVVRVVLAADDLRAAA